MMKKSIIVILLFLMSAGCNGQPESAGERIVEIALGKLGTPYVAGTLEQEPERLIVDTTKTDCILFVEMCVAMVQGYSDYSSLCRNIQNLRYRDGIVDGYSSRLHYTSEWISQGISKGLFEDVTVKCGGHPSSIEFNFMSTHPDAYLQLKGHPEEVAKIAEIERHLTLQDYSVLDKKDFEACANNIEEGDLICFVTSVKGLDISHVAIAHRQDDKLTFIHASTKANKVIVNPESLSDYLSAQKSVTGIRIIRVK